MSATASTTRSYKISAHRPENAQSASVPESQTKSMDRCLWRTQTAAHACACLGEFWMGRCPGRSHLCETERICQATNHCRLASHTHISTIPTFIFIYQRLGDVPFDCLRKALDPDHRARVEQDRPQRGMLEQPGRVRARVRDVEQASLGHTSNTHTRTYHRQSCQRANIRKNTHDTLVGFLTMWLKYVSSITLDSSMLCSVNSKMPDLPSSTISHAMPRLRIASLNLEPCARRNARCKSFNHNRCDKQHTLQRFSPARTRPRGPSACSAGSVHAAQSWAPCASDSSLLLCVSLPKCPLRCMASPTGLPPRHFVSLTKSSLGL